MRDARGPDWLHVAVCILASAAAYYVSIGLGELWPAAWVAPVPLLWLAYRTGWPVAAASALTASFLGNLNLLTLLTTIAPTPIVIAALFAPAAICAAAVLASRAAVRRLPPFVAVLAFPAVLTAAEFLLSLVSPHGTIHSIAYSQTDVLPLLQIASVTGVWGMTFALAILPSAIAVGITTSSATAAVPAVIALLLTLGWGALRVHHHPDEARIRVGLVATDDNIHQVFATEEREIALKVAGEYAARIARAAGRGARIVILPEKLVGITPQDAPEVLQVFSDAARASRVMLVAGVNRVGETPPRNVAVVIGADGTPLATYDKHHLLPGPEAGYQVGTRPVFFDGPSTRWGVAICKDMDFTAWLRRYGRNDVRVLAVPAWDFVIDGRFHARMAIVRAVEQGFTLVRSAQAGLLTVSTAYGRVIAETPSAPGRGALLVADVPAGPGATLYTRRGDWFAWSVVGGAFMLLVALVGRGDRSRKTGQGRSSTSSRTAVIL